MFTILSQLFASCFGVFSSDRRVRINSATAFVCVLLAIGCGILTAWLAQPGYQAILLAKGSTTAAVQTSWFAAGIVGFVMFILSGFLARFVVEGWIYDKPIEHQKPAAIVLALWLIIGAADVFVSWQGASIRAISQTAIQPSENTAAGALPYADRIQAIDRSISELKHVYAWCGTHKTRHPLQPDLTYTCTSQRVHFASTKYTRTRYPADRAELTRLESQRAKYEGLQTQAVELSQAATADANQLSMVIRETAAFSLHFMSVFVYLIQLVAGGFVAYFMELKNREDSNLFANSQKSIDTHQEEPEPEAVPQMGYQVSGRHTVKRMDPDPMVQIISKHGYEITCQHCGKKAWKTSPNRAKYCCEACRIAANEKRTGKKLRKRKRNE